jgi:hypothetical protein
LRFSLPEDNPQVSAPSSFSFWKKSFFELTAAHLPHPAFFVPFSLLFPPKLPVFLPPFVSGH